MVQTHSLLTPRTRSARRRATHAHSAITWACLVCMAGAVAPAFAQASASATGTAGTAGSAAQPAAELAPVVIQGTYENAVGTSNAASQGVVTAKLIESRPTLRPAEVMEFVPGVIVTQHSGDGKANQYFLRGFNLDHGTDFATYVDGMPVNMPTHAHGHGYSDLNWLIPELISRISYKKGPYFADEGDFSSAGVARLGLFDGLADGIASLTLGEHSYDRALLTQSVPWQSGKLLYAVETAHNNGPWDAPERFHRANGVLRYSTATDNARTSLTAMAYSAAWHATDQIPQRAVEQGLVGRFGALDPTDGGNTERYSLSFQTERKADTGTFKANAYAFRSQLNLVSNFTYDLGPHACRFAHCAAPRVGAIRLGAARRRIRTRPSHRSFTATTRAASQAPCHPRKAGPSTPHPPWCAPPAAR